MTTGIKHQQPLQLTSYLPSFTLQTQVMHIHIHDETTLHEIRQVFSDYYPFLKLEFYKTPHRAFAASPDEKLLNHQLKMKEIRKVHTDGLLEIHPTQTVGTLEKELRERFDLFAQVCKIEKGSWVQTTGMDTFTLKEVNELSRNNSDEFLVSDYDAGFETAS